MVKAKAKPADYDAQFAEYLAKARAEADEWLDRKAEELKALHPSIPIAWHRNNLVARSGLLGCPCMSVITEVEKGSK